VASPDHMPCPECGAAIPRVELASHVCERERWLDYQVLARRKELGRLEEELDAFLSTPRGRFELWYASRERRRRWGFAA
jgi:hypothetical protein